MSSYLEIETRNAVFQTMAELLRTHRKDIIEANKKDVANYNGGDVAMFDRLKVDDTKVNEMVRSLEQLGGMLDPLGIERFSFTHDNGLKISNKTAPFGTILIIYESRPDVTIEAAGIAFKSGNKILLKGGKEAVLSNLLLVDLWHRALEKNGASKDWVHYLEFDRKETQAFLESPTRKLDLIVPRGGEKLIAFVKQHATCPVIVSGRGNNFLFVDKEADIEMAFNIILNAKTAKISACNALDKVLIHAELPNKHAFLKHLVTELIKFDIQILTDKALSGLEKTEVLENENVWFEEFLDYKIVLGQVDGLATAVEMINKYGGGHSASIVTRAKDTAIHFMQSVDSAAVYHNASTRFTDGGQFGLGAELAISTDKLHQRGPLGLQHLVTNKWYVHGNGQVR